jgi:catechol 2,3-dioxygenase-like lactoylglutathione lyase family enzyme
LINGVHHVSIATNDLDGMLAFYADLLGLSVRRRAAMEPANPAFQTVVGIKDAHLHGAWLRGGNVEIEFFQYTQPVGRPLPARPACDAGIRHICFDVTDIHAEYARLRAVGIEFLSEPQHITTAGVWSVYARDPDGNIVELQEILPDSSMERLADFGVLKRST